MYGLLNRKYNRDHRSAQSSTHAKQFTHGHVKRGPCSRGFGRAEYGAEMQMKDQRSVIPFRARRKKSRDGVFRVRGPGSPGGTEQPSGRELEPRGEAGSHSCPQLPVGSSHCLNLTRSQWTREPGECDFQGADATQSRAEGHRLDLSPISHMASTTEERLHKTHMMPW